LERGCGTDIGSALQRVPMEIDETGEATMRSMALPALSRSHS
jgi:hypothetical protein